MFRITEARRKGHCYWYWIERRIFWIFRFIVAWPFLDKKEAQEYIDDYYNYTN